MRKRTNSIECDESKKEKAEEIVEEYDYGKSYELNILIGLCIPCVLAILHLILASVFGKTIASAITHPLLAIMVPLALFLILKAYILRDRFEAAVEFLELYVEENRLDKNAVEDEVIVENTNMTKDEIIGCLENLRDHFVSFEENEMALNFAIDEIKKGIPAKPIDDGTWSPKTCPTCGFSLSEHERDGYYKDLISLEFCPACRQVLDWDTK